jgi:hypothetical protein
MVSEFIQVYDESNKPKYTAIFSNGSLYRGEMGKLATWKLYGGAIKGVDFDSFAVESAPQSPISRVIGWQYEGVNDYAGMKLADLARLPLQIGFSLIATPVNSPKMKNKGQHTSETFVLSGRIRKLTELPDLDEKDITTLLNIK